MKYLYGKSRSASRERTGRASSCSYRFRDSFNENGSLLIIMPLTSKIKCFFGCKILEPNSENGLVERSEILTFQIRCISTERLVNKVGVTQEGGYG